MGVNESDAKGTKSASTHSPDKPMPFSLNDYVELQTKINMDSFETISLIGRGTFGKVILVRNKEDGSLYAMKQIRKDIVIKHMQKEHIKAERMILGKVAFPFIVKMKYAFQTKSKLFLVFEYVQGGELFFHLDKSQYFTEERARFYAAEVFLTLEFLHNQKIIFRDLKPENILLDSTGHVKVTDFGLAKDFTVGAKEKANSFCGTAEYLAPEIIQNKEYDKSVDYWALGILVYEMLTGAPPFEDDNRNNLYNKILHNQPDLKHPNISMPAADLLKKMLEKDAKARIKPEDIKKHPFFKTIDFTKLLLKELSPPFLPAQDKSSLTVNISEEFKGEQLKETASASTSLAGKDVHFSHFTYLPNGNSISDEGVTAKLIK